MSSTLPIRISRTALLALVSAAAVGCMGPGPVAESEDPPSDPLVNSALGLERSDIVRPEMVPEPDGGTRILLPIAGEERELLLEPLSIRSDSFQLYAQTGDGSLVSLQAPPSQTVRGEIAGAADGLVTGAWMQDGLHARIALSPDQVYWIEPAVRVSAERAGDYVLYRDRDVIPPLGAGELDDVVEIPGEDGDSLGVAGAVQGASGLAVAELALDADFEFFQAWGSVENALTRMEAVIAAVNDQYEAEVGITHVITAAIVRTAEPDPYTSTDPGTLLQNELRPQWLDTHTDIQRDVVHLFTGKDLDSSVIGIAYLGSICSSYGFGLSQSDFSTNFACVTDLTSHEVGHNWAADHCDCASNTMNSFLTCSNAFHPDLTVPEIEGHRDSRTCLTFGDACPEDPDKTDPGQCGCGVPDTDTDGDGTADCVDDCPDDANKTDPGQCGCGLPDVHSDDDGVADCDDACPNDGEKIDPGQCGCGVPDTDTDGDGTADCVDGCPNDPTTTDSSQCEDPVCGDGTCDAGESSCACPEDCGAAPTAETLCTDGLDDDCDGAVDCDDADCDADAACAPACAADGDSCRKDVDCCSGDCSGGPPGQRTCLGDSAPPSCVGNGGACAADSDCCSGSCRTKNGESTCRGGGPKSGQVESLSLEGGAGSGPVTGGCAIGDGGAGGGALLFCALFALALRRRRRRWQVDCSTSDREEAASVRGGGPGDPGPGGGGRRAREARRN